MVRKILFPIVLLTLVGCKPTQVSFSESDITADYVKKLLITAKETADTSFTKGTIFIANLEEDLINRDGIAEQTIVNTKSNNPRSGVAMIGNSYKLFIITTNSLNNRSIFLPAIFTADDECIGLGPALIGDFGAGQLNYKKRIRCKPNRKTHEAKWEYSIKENEFGKTGSILDPKDNSFAKLEITFETDSKKNISSLADFRIVNIYNISPNRFGGNKPLVFNIATIFEDDQALYFKLLRPF
jgi:hypothetical protein